MKIYNRKVGKLDRKSVKACILYHVSDQRLKSINSNKFKVKKFAQNFGSIFDFCNENFDSS